MDIPNLSQNNQPISPKPTKTSNTGAIIFIILIVGIVFGFWMSRFIPSKKSGNNIISTIANKNIISADSVKDSSELVVGKSYGDTSSVFKDNATGTIEKGNINGVGTHILNREGGVSQRAALTSSVIDLDMFVGKKVEVKGETNSSNKAAWLMDVGVIKIVE